MHFVPRTQQMTRGGNACIVQQRPQLSIVAIHALSNHHVMAIWQPAVHSADRCDKISIVFSHMVAPNSANNGDICLYAQHFSQFVASTFPWLEEISIETVMYHLHTVAAVPAANMALLCGLGAANDEV